MGEEREEGREEGGSGGGERGKEASYLGCSPSNDCVTYIPIDY